MSRDGVGDEYRARERPLGSDTKGVQAREDG